MKIYDENGYVDITGILDKGYPFTIICGGRGTGKTFGALLYAVRSTRKFMLMRRTQKQADKIAMPEFTPFTAVSRVHPEYRVIAKKSGDVGTIHRVGLDTDGNEIPEMPPIGYVCALSTFASLRGFDASDVELLVLDEFIPEMHEKVMRNEGEALLNAYETIDRNRQLEGRPPLQLLALANSNRIDNPLLEAFGLINLAMEMTTGKRSPIYANPERGILLIMLQDSPISKKKAKTALYKAVEGSGYNQMALQNQFVNSDWSNIKSVNLSGYDAIAGIGEITIYRNRAKRCYHVSNHRSGSPDLFNTDDTDVKRFRRAFSRVWFAYIERNNVTFENPACLVLFEKYFT